MQIEGRTNRVELASVEIEQELTIAAPPAHVYDCYVNGISQWWSRDWVMGGPRTTEIVIEQQPGGRLLEVWEGGGGCLWAFVQSLSPGRMISFSIPEGVMWSGAGMFRLVFADAEDGNGTVLKLSHHCFNQYSEDAHSGYVEGWTELIGRRLKEHAEDRAVDNAVRPGGTLA
ncbi:hypothetical protein KDL44_05185 [bacterium]|nr:hypothetical protein [bacterium]